MVAETTRRLHAALGEVFNAGRGTVIVGVDLEPSTLLLAELLVTALVSVIRAELLKADARRLVSLAPSLMTFIVEPYLAQGAANADAGNALALPARAEAKVVPIRAHPTIIAVLRAIAATPALSSRQIEGALGAGESRGSDLSEVLKRLQQRGLIESTRGTRNQPNAWHLTPYGRRVREVMADSFHEARGREQPDSLRQRAPRQASPRGRSQNSAVQGSIA